MDRVIKIPGKNRIPRVLIVFVIITTICLFLFNRSYVRNISCFALLLYAMFLPIDDLACLIAAVFPTGKIFKLFGGYTVVPFLLLIYIFKTMVLNGRKVSMDVMRPIFWVMILFVSTIITTTLLNIGITGSLSFYAHLIFIIVALRINRINRAESYDKISFYFIVSTLYVCAMTLVFPEVSRSLGNILYGRVNPGFSSSWDFGRSLIVSIAFVAVRFLKTKKRLFIDLVLVFIMLYFVVQCGRFSMVLGLAALIFCMPLEYISDKPKRERILYFLFAMIMVSIIGAFIYVYVYSSMAELRGVEASDNGRYGVWSTYWDYFLSNPQVVCFGAGAGAISSVGAGLNTVTAHNIVIEKVAEVGVFGCFVLFCMFVNLYKGKIINPTRNIYILPLITFLGTTLTQGTTGNETFALLLAMCPSDQLDNDINL